MHDIPPPSATTIRNLFDSVRTRIVPLVRRWRMRRIGDEVQRLFEAVAAALDRNPAGSDEVIDAVSALGALLERAAPIASAVVDPALDALFELHLALTDQMPIVSTNLATLTLDERAELEQAFAAERARQAAGLPPSDADGHDCAICAVLARQRERRAS